MRSLDRKVLRDLWQIRGQALAIVLVIVGGVSTFVMSLSAVDSLESARARFYRDNRFADVFSDVKRAPEGVSAQLEGIPGVEQVETRVVAPVRLRVEGFGDPITGQLVSVSGQPDALNRVFVKAGRMPAPHRGDEVLLSDGFAGAHGLGLGDTLSVVVNGHRRDLRIVGVALAPDFVFQLGPGTLLPDFKRYAILWMEREPLGTAFDMDGAFNQVSISLAPRASPEDVLERVDAALAPYGGKGAYGRKDQLSHRYLNEEFKTLALMARVLPLIFLGVAAFLLNVVVARLINTQREQIAVLKAFGYRNGEVGFHYCKLVVAVVLIGTTCGTALGAVLGAGTTSVFLEFYRFPSAPYEVRAWIVASAALVTLMAGISGTLFSVSRAVRLPPAEAMRPEPPATYRVSLVEQLGLSRFFSQPARMVVRSLERRPVNTLLSVIGVSFAGGLVVLSASFSDAADYTLNVQYNLVQREDLTVVFTEPTSRRALFEIESIAGVERGEPYREVPVVMRHGHLSRRTGIRASEPKSVLRQLIDGDDRVLQPPPAGLLLSAALADLLKVRPGETVTVQALEGTRRVTEIPVAGLVHDYLGTSGYMSLDALNRLLGEGHAVSGADLAIDPGRQEEIQRALLRRPRVAGVTSSGGSLASTREAMDRQMLTFAFLSTLLAATISFAVVYNAARIALSERSRELASLRVLGFTRWEVSTILLGELAVITALAIPLGWGLGVVLCYGTVQTWQNEIIRIPFVIEPQTFAFSAVIVVASAGLSALIVRRRLDRLDLVSALKTRE